MEPNEYYLDTNLLIGWVRHILSKKKPLEPKFIVFLKQHPEIKTWISTITIAEIVEFLQKDFGKHNLTFVQMKKVIEKMQKIIGFRIINAYVTDEGMEEIKDIVLNARNLVLLTYEGRDVKDAIHVEIARQNRLWFITRDIDVGRMKRIYAYIDTAEKLMKKFN